MTRASCTRAWEAEAARDDRLPQAARIAFELHAQHCQHCAHEQRELADLAARLRRAVPPVEDPVLIARQRRRLLETLEPAAASGSVARRLHALIWVAPVVCALVPLGVWTRFTPHNAEHRARATSSPAPERARLRLIAGAGARFEQKRDATLDVVTLYDGSMSIAFDRGPHNDLVVRVPDGEIHDLGTVFNVSVADSRTAEISVSEGAVTFVRSGQPDAIVLAGEVFHADAPKTLPAAPLGAGGGHASLDSSNFDAGRSAKQARSRIRTHKAPATTRATTSPQDVAYLQILALREQGREREAREAARNYLQHFPDGFRRSEVEQMVGAAR